MSPLQKHTLLPPKKSCSLQELPITCSIMQLLGSVYHKQERLDDAVAILSSCVEVSLAFISCICSSK